MTSGAEGAHLTTTLERTFSATVDEVWEMWTTKEGIDSWWGPDGFEVDVRHIDLRAGGDLTYVMTATGADQIEYMKKAGMPLVNHHTVTFTEVEPGVRLALADHIDFIEGVEPYRVNTIVDFEVVAAGIRLVLTIDAMHDEHWTRMMVLGRESELVRLAEVLDRRHS